MSRVAAQVVRHVLKRKSSVCLYAAGLLVTLRGPPLVAALAAPGAAAESTPELPRRAQVSATVWPPVYPVSLMPVRPGIENA